MHHRHLVFTAQLLLTLIISILLTMAPIVSAKDFGDPLPRFIHKQYASVHGHRMAYVDVGVGDPIVFLHGNPSSSYLWRHVMAVLEGHGRLIAPDLIGMGDSDKLPGDDPNRYSVQQHANYLYSLLETLGVKRNVTFVIHDWGSALGFHWAYLHRDDPQAVKGIAFMEAMVMPFDSSVRPQVKEFKDLFATKKSEELVLQHNYFVEEIMPTGIIRNLTDKEMNEWRRPFANPGEDRRPTFTFPSEIPVDGSPQAPFKMVSDYSKWLSSDRHVRKLFLRAEPGSTISQAEITFIRTWTNVDEVAIKGRHYVQEDDPITIGDAIARWLLGCPESDSLEI